MLLKTPRSRGFSSAELALWASVAIRVSVILTAQIANDYQNQLYELTPDEIAIIEAGV
jgi:hypothetical protein